ncbi:hypothetical protein C8J57DRAFT_1524311 [Mycena rebaudengoi]|nr:hypothetical protein C8J57DRAFT_1524311 [Mycena rebaudengoi]
MSSAEKAMLLEHLMYTADLNRFFQTQSALATLPRPSLPVVTGSGGPKVLPKFHAGTDYTHYSSQLMPPSDSAETAIAPVTKTTKAKPNTSPSTDLK